MRNADAQPIIRLLLDHIERGEPWTTEPSSTPVSHYTDRGRLTAERRRLFDNLPQVVGLSGDVPDAGSFVTRDQFGYSIVVSRGTDGVVRALANVCAHRGSEVVTEERGCRRRHTCPYHGWVYDTEGTLVGLPYAAGFPDVTVSGDGMVELPTVEHRGVIWVLPNAEHNNLLSVPRLGGIAEDFTAFDLAGHRPWRHHRFDLALNWKLVVDTFLEPYHFPALHKATVGPIFLPNLCHAERHGPHVRVVYPRRTITALADEAPESWDLVPHSALVYVLFPATVVVMLVDHVETWRIRPHPDGDPAHCLVDLDFYVPTTPTPGPESAAVDDGHWERNWRLTIDTVENEDFATMAGVQRGAMSGAFDEFRFGANEPALSMYHQSLDAAMATSGGTST